MLQFETFPVGPLACTCILAWDAAEGRGVVVVGAHYDGIELAMRHVADASGQPMPILVRRNNDPCIEAAIAQAEARARDADRTLKAFTAQFQAAARTRDCGAALAALNNACPTLRSY